MTEISPRSLWFCAVLTFALCGSLNAQDELSSLDPEDEPIAEFCSGPEFRQFDFWLGTWKVTNAAGKVAGTNTITRVANGCALHEYWRGASGRSGTSLNMYDRRTGRWSQLWVGLGLILELRGGIEDGKMVLAGEREDEDGKVIDRITWTPLDGGRVRQLWEASRDGGATWKVLFDGLYARV